jgi:hypothetical protein
MKLFARRRRLTMAATYVLAAIALPIIALLFQLVQAPIAEAGSCSSGPILAEGRRAYCGYFNNQYDDGTNPFGGFVFAIANGQSLAIPNSIDTKASFINFIHSYLVGGNAEDKTGAEFVILTMLGKTGGTPRADAAADYNTWAAGINAATIDWHYLSPFPCTILNSFYQKGGSNDDAYFQGGPGCGPGATVDSIAFKNSSGTILYVIKRLCGNPIGVPKPLVVADFNIQLTAASATSWTPNTIIAGSVNTLSVTLKNTKTTDSVPGTLQVEMPGGGVVQQPCGPTCTPGGMTTLSNGEDSSRGYRAARGAAQFPVGANWFWDVKAIKPGANTTGAITFTVPTTAVPGTFTINVYYYDATQGSTLDHATVTFKIVSKRSPGFAGANGDVQAGGGLCGQTLANPSAGVVQGSAAAKSGDQYVVSASAAGGINAFTSNSGGSNTLNLGSSGGYAQVCRADLLASAESYVTQGGTGYGTIGLAQAANLDVGTLTMFPVYYYTGGGILHLHGTVGQKLTIVDESGTIQITGNITLTNVPTAPKDTPSLGIISKGDIDINKAATLVDAYLFTDSTIDTCTEGQSSTTACDTPQLVINGFLMANKISFRRIGAFNTNGTSITEQVNLNPEIYLNPPMFFDASVDNVTLQGQGEQQPLF